MKFIFILMLLTNSKEDLTFEFVEEQQFDTSCGLSSVATLLKGYWNLDASENQIIEKFILENPDFSNYTSSLLDLSKIIEQYGLKTKSFQMDLDQLKNATKTFAPILVHYKKPDEHFALVLGCDDDSVITIDPARGIEVLWDSQFLKRWSGVTLLSASKDMESNKEKILSAMEISLKRKKLLEKWAW